MKRSREAQPAAPPLEADQRALLAGAEETARKFVEALARGDAAAAESFVFGKEDFEAAIHAGHRSILEGTIRAQNSALVAKLAETLRGKVVRSTFEPGPLTRSGTKGTYLKDFPVLGSSPLKLDVDGVPVEVHLEQMVHTEKGWRIFRIRLP